MRIRRHLQSLPILSCRETIAIYKRALIELMADARLDMCGIVCDSSWHDPVACAFPPEHDGPHSWASIPALQPATLGLPPDLVRVLRDPTITIDRDHEIRLADGRTLFEHLAEWRKAPSNTASSGEVRQENAPE